ncbi:MAG TPA: hypothetical protein VG722_03725 [Tepidisphaeraceae bacterium]|nr:hypothetical protein [Tepidisphaeraceae bacterium]
MQWLPDTLALLIGVAGWFYLFYSRAAHKLTGVEDPKINTRRIVLRRVAGVTLLLLAVMFYAGFATLDRRQSAEQFLLIWGVVLFLLLVVLVLGLVDFRYTVRFYHDRKKK